MVRSFEGLGLGLSRYRLRRLSEASIGLRCPRRGRGFGVGVMAGAPRESAEGLDGWICSAWVGWGPGCGGVEALCRRY